jgi:hypothetical protein
MKYEENSGPGNFKRFEQLAKQVLSVSAETVKKKLEEEKRDKQSKKKPKR